MLRNAGRRFALRLCMTGAAMGMACVALAEPLAFITNQGSHDVSVIDLIANCGPRSAASMKYVGGP